MHEDTNKPEMSRELTDNLLGPILEKIVAYNRAMKALKLCYRKPAVNFENPDQSVKFKSPVDIVEHGDATYTAAAQIINDLQRFVDMAPPEFLSFEYATKNLDETIEVAEDIPRELTKEWERLLQHLNINKDKLIEASQIQSHEDRSTFLDEAVGHSWSKNLVEGYLSIQKMKATIEGIREVFATKTIEAQERPVEAQGTKAPRP